MIRSYSVRRDGTRWRGPRAAPHTSSNHSCLDQLLHLLHCTLCIGAQSVCSVLEAPLCAAQVALEPAALAGGRTLPAIDRAQASALEAVELADHTAERRVGLGGLPDLVAERRRRSDLDQQRPLCLAPERA